jgi:hypothetical protein
LTHEPQAHAPPAEQVLGSALTCFGTPLQLGGDGPVTTLNCGHYALDCSVRHPFINELPQVIHLREQDNPQAEWMSTVAALSAAGCASDRQGARVVADRLAEALLAQVLRAYLQQLDSPPGFLAALLDAPLSTALAQRFRCTVGTIPMDYLTHWRMQVSAELLLSPAEPSIAQVSEQVGYQ